MLLAAALFATIATPAVSAASRRPAGPPKVRLTVWGFTSRGYNTAGLEAQAKQYAASHPGFVVTVTSRESAAHHAELAEAFANRTAPDIAIVDSDLLPGFVAHPADLANLTDLGAARFQRSSLAWRWDQGVSADGQRFVAMPADLGGLALVYRADLFAKAGLAKDRTEFRRRALTWDALIDMCAKFVVAIPGTKCLDNSALLFDAVKDQGTTRFSGRNGELLHDRNPQVRRAWDLAVKATRANISAEVAPDSAAWSAGLAGGLFAVVAVPLWQLRAIEAQAASLAGAWDVVALPEGGGSVGGTHVLISARSRHVTEAFDVVQTMVSPESQLAMFSRNGVFPSTPSVYESADVAGFSSAYFSNAPIGRVLADGAKRLHPYFRGPLDQVIEREFLSGLGRVVRGAEEPEVAWTSTLAAIAAAAAAGRR